jgi:hypothetical protein
VVDAQPILAQKALTKQAFCCPMVVPPTQEAERHEPALRSDSLSPLYPPSAALIEIDQPDPAQQLADRFARLGWVKILQRWARRINPLLGQDWLSKRDYYWVIDQAEYSTDLFFANRAALADLYPRLLDHAVLNFSAQDILTFLGRRLPPLRRRGAHDFQERPSTRCPYQAPGGTEERSP